MAREEDDDEWGHFFLSDEETNSEENEQAFGGIGEESPARFSSSRYNSRSCVCVSSRLETCGTSMKDLSDAVCSMASLDEAPKKRKKREGRVSIQARVRKRRDDFCEGRRSIWAVERWHVFAPRLLKRGGEYLPDRDGVVLSPAFQTRVATRFFKRGGKDSTAVGTTVSFSMGSIRVVSTRFERYAQYELVVSVDGVKGSAWRRYSAFRALVESVAAESAPRNIVRTLSAWADAQDAKRIFRCTHPAYLIQRYYHFEHVLREALFELPRPELLLSFLRADHPDQDDVGASSTNYSSGSGSSTTSMTLPLPTTSSSPSTSPTTTLYRRDDVWNNPFTTSPAAPEGATTPDAALPASPVVRCH